MQTKRYGIYYAPDASSSLWQLGCQWLGRDSVTGETFDQPDFVSSPRRYGFHATLKPPFQLGVGYSLDQLSYALEQFSNYQAPIDIGEMKLAAIGGYLAIVPTNQSDETEDFAAKCMQQFDHYREPMSAEQRARRMSGQLSERQIELLDLWGYPYVLDEFRFHMTLTDKLADDKSAKTMTAAKNWFAAVIDNPVVLDRICLFEEPERGAPFMRIADFELKA